MVKLWCYLLRLVEYGNGKWAKCRHCGNETLHFIVDVFSENTHIYRCSICNATLITQD